MRLRAVDTTPQAGPEGQGAAVDDAWAAAAAVLLHARGHHGLHQPGEQALTLPAHHSMLLMASLCKGE